MSTLLVDSVPRTRIPTNTGKLTPTLISYDTLGPVKLRGEINNSPFGNFY
jgi:hypothetical protein